MKEIEPIAMGLSPAVQEYLEITQNAMVAVTQLLGIPRSMIGLHCYYRVREYPRRLHDKQGLAIPGKMYWVYVSPRLYDWKEALTFAVEYEKRTGIKCWVEALRDD